MRRYLKWPLYVKILIGMGLGLCWGLLSVQVGWSDFTLLWIKPWGAIFVRMLKFIAVPLVLISLIDGLSNMHELSRLSRIGGKTVGLYLLTTVLAIGLGLGVVNAVRPGDYLPETQKETLRNRYVTKADSSIEGAKNVKEQGPLQPLVDLVPNNLILAASSNRNMLQIIFFALLFGMAMVSLPRAHTAPLKAAISATAQVLLKLVGLIMRLAPYGVFALLGAMIVELVGPDPANTLSLFKALGAYALSVLASLALMMFVFYPFVLRLIAKLPYQRFLSAMMPAQLLAFSTSSSAATLPVTMRRVEKKLGVSEKIASFVLPMGATVNMDGTSIHQAISAVFIAQAFGTELGMSEQLIIVLTATLSSIGAAAVPGSGLIMLVIVLGAIGIDPQGLALIIALDRPLDMCRTAVNVTGDATVATLVAHSENEWRLPPKSADRTDHKARPTHAETTHATPSSLS